MIIKKKAGKNECAQWLSLFYTFKNGQCPSCVLHWKSNCFSTK